MVKGGRLLGGEAKRLASLSPCRRGCPSGEDAQRVQVSKLAYTVQLTEGSRPCCHQSPFSEVARGKRKPILLFVQVFEPHIDL